MSSDDDELERRRQLIPPVDQLPNHTPLPGAKEALERGLRIRVMKQNRKTLPPSPGSDFDPHTGQ